MSKEGCVPFYKWGTALIRIPFPNGETSCHYCPHLRYDDGCRRNYCSLTREFIVSPFNSRGLDCPVVFDDEDSPEPEKNTWKAGTF